MAIVSNESPHNTKLPRDQSRAIAKSPLLLEADVKNRTRSDFFNTLSQKRKSKRDKKVDAICVRCPRCRRAELPQTVYGIGIPSTAHYLEKSTEM